MTEYLVRHTGLARAVHWAHTIATITLFYTGIAIYTAGTNFLVGGPGGVAVSVWVHRGAAIVFIAAPLLGIIVRPSGLKHLFKALLKPWDKEDWLWTKRFVPHLVVARKVHLPPHNGEIKAGQRVASLGMIAFSVLIVITGFMLWFDGQTAAGAVRWAVLLHELSMMFLGVLLLGHIYLGAGIFQPLRGMIYTMFGNGKISYRDAQFNWPVWAEEQAAVQRQAEQTETQGSWKPRSVGEPGFESPSRAEES